MKKKADIKTIIEEVILVILTVLIMIPVYYFVIGAFKTRQDIVKYPLVITKDMIDSVGFSNFTYVLKKMNLLKALKNTTIITAVSLAIEIIAGSLAGYALARIKRKGFQILYTCVIAIMVVPFIGCLIALVIQSTQIHTYGTLFGSIIVLVGWHMPFTTFLFTEFMAAVPKELEEAAYIDGCSTFGVYRRVFLPLIKPVVATCCIRSGVGSWNDFIISSSVGNVAKSPTLMVALTKFFGQRTSEYGYAFAGMLLSSLPIIIMYVFLQKYFIKGLTAGAVKG